MAARRPRRAPEREHLFFLIYSIPFFGTGAGNPADFLKKKKAEPPVLPFLSLRSVRNSEIAPVFEVELFDPFDDRAVDLAVTAFAQTERCADFLHCQFFVVVEDDDQPFVL